MVRTVVKAGMPVPDQQIWVVANGRRYCIDVGYLPEKVGIEFDGWWAHGQTHDGLRRATATRSPSSSSPAGSCSRSPHATTASVLIDRVQRALAQRCPTFWTLSPLDSGLSVRKSEEGGVRATVPDHGQ